MHQLEFTKNLTLNPEGQIAVQLVEQSNTLYLKPGDYSQQRKKLINFYLNWHAMIRAQHRIEDGYKGNWMPRLRVRLENGKILGNNSGYWDAGIKDKDDILMLERPREKDEDIMDEMGYLNNYYFYIPILEIADLTYLYY